MIHRVTLDEHVPETASELSGRLVAEEHIMGIEHNPSLLRNSALVGCQSNVGLPENKEGLSVLWVWLLMLLF